MTEPTTLEGLLRECPHLLPMRDKPDVFDWREFDRAAAWLRKRGVMLVESKDEKTHRIEQFERYLELANAECDQLREEVRGLETKQAELQQSRIKAHRLWSKDTAEIQRLKQRLATARELIDREINAAKGRHYMLPEDCKWVLDAKAWREEGGGDD